jgi:hypothetical protein
VTFSVNSFTPGAAAGPGSQAAGCRGTSSNVGGLEVAVDDPRLVGRVHGPGQGLDHLRRLPGRQGRAAQPGRQVAAGAELQGEVRQPALLADLVDLDDVRVLQPGHRRRFGAEPPDLLVARQGAGPDHLQRHQPVEDDVPRPVDDTHAASAQFPQHLVAGDGRQGTVPSCRLSLLRGSRWRLGRGAVRLEAGFLGCGSLDGLAAAPSFLQRTAGCRHPPEQASDQGLVLGETPSVFFRSGTLAPAIV